MNMTGIKVLTLTPLIAAMDLPAGTEKYGLVACLIAAVITVYVDGRNERKAAAKREVDNIKAMASVAETNRTTAAILVEVKDAIKSCRAASSIRDELNHSDQRQNHEDSQQKHRDHQGTMGR